MNIVDFFKNIIKKKLSWLLVPISLYIIFYKKELIKYFSYVFICIAIIGTLDTYLIYLTYSAKLKLLFMSIWRVKPVAAFEADMKKSDLKRILTRWGLTSLGIGAIIGGGIFTLTGIAAHDYAGPALALSFVIAGIGCLFASLCYAEFASVLPVEGSAYAYAYGTVGELFAWFIGWNLILEYMMGATTVAVAWSGYFVKFLHLFDNFHDS
jgi:amino acid transporter